MATAGHINFWPHRDDDHDDREDCVRAAMEHHQRLMGGSIHRSICAFDFGSGFVMKNSDKENLVLLLL